MEAAKPTAGASKPKAEGSDTGETAKAIRDVIRRSSLQTAMLTLEPVPLLDTAIFTPLQVRMVESIARLRGYDLDSAAVLDTSKMIRGHLILPNLTLAAIKLVQVVPVVPELFSGAIGMALTSAIGELADRYFRTGRRMSPAELRKCFDTLFKNEFARSYRERRDELRAMFRSPQVRHEMAELKRAYRCGEVDPDDLARRMTAIVEAPGAKRSEPSSGAS
jgi:uncharacterized protein (DUF697 family)